MTSSVQFDLILIFFFLSGSDSCKSGIAIPDISFQPTTEAAVMGIIRSSFLFIAGTTFGIYLVQNYQIPNLRNLADTALLHAKQVEEKYRKSKKKSDDD